jgi:thiamine-phosphate pyrophosphorylase
MMALEVFAVAVVAPRSPRRVGEDMSLADRLQLMVLTDAALLEGRDAVAACRAAVEGGATAIQVRWKDGAPAQVAELTRALVAALAVPVLVDDRVDVALAAGAAGAHLGQEDVPLAAIRPRVPPGFLLGLSIGTPDEAAAATAALADYWSIGPISVTGSKSDAGAALGPEGFARLAALAPEGMPVIAIGGITPDNAGAVIRAGAVGVAVIAAVWSATDPTAAARALRLACA